LNDLALAVEVTKELQIPCGVVLNRSGTENSTVEDYCRQKDIPVLLKIPLDMEIARIYSMGIPLVRGFPSWREPFRQLFRDIQQIVSAG
jgi:MinD superfamily P-loop ATPase